MSKSVAMKDLAAHHASKANGLANALEHNVFSDDADAPEALAQRIMNNEAKGDQMKRINALYRKGDAAGLAALGLNLETMRAKLKDALSWLQQPYPAYELTNLGARIRTDKQRLESIKAQQERAAAAQASDAGVSVEKCAEGYIRVTFAEKPEREILDALKAAGYFWNRGSWAGREVNLPECVRQTAL